MNAAPVDVEAIRRHFLFPQLRRVVANNAATGGGRGRRGGRHQRRSGDSGMHTLVSCPACGVAAEIEDRFFLPSTDGPIEHVVVNCAAGHHFRMSAGSLSAAQPRSAAATSSCAVPGA